MQFYILIFLSFLFVGCGGDSSPTEQPESKKISGKIYSSNDAKARALSDIGDISEILALVIKDGSADVKNVTSVAVSNNGSFEASITPSANSKVLLLMKSDSEQIDLKITGVVPLSSSSSGSMTSFPTSNISSDIDLGDIRKENNETISTNTLESNIDNFSLEQNVLDKLIKLDDIDKMAINKYINYNKTTGVYFEPAINFAFEKIPVNRFSNQFTSISDYTYEGYRIPILTNKTSLLDFTNLCNTTKRIEIVPPTTITEHGQANTFSQANPIVNDTISPDSIEMCNSNGLWIHHPYANNTISIEVSTIAGQTIPSGHWKLKEDGIEQASFDVSIGSIFDQNNNYRILIPTFQLQTDNNDKFTKFLIKWYLYNDATSQYEEVTNSSIISASIKTFYLDFHGTNLSGDNLGGNEQYDIVHIEGSDILKGEITASQFINTLYFQGATKNVNSLYVSITYTEGVQVLFTSEDIN